MSLADRWEDDLEPAEQGRIAGERAAEEGSRRLLDTAYRRVCGGAIDNARQLVAEHGAIGALRRTLRDRTAHADVEEVCRRDIRALLGDQARGDVERVLHALTLPLSLGEPITLDRLARSWEETTAPAFREARRVGAARVLAGLGGTD